MKAKILSADKKHIEQVDSTTGENVSIPMVLVRVQFELQDGNPYITNSYFVLPDAFQPGNEVAYFDPISDQMQQDIDRGINLVGVFDAETRADEIIKILTGQTA